MQRYSPPSPTLRRAIVSAVALGAVVLAALALLAAVFGGTQVLLCVVVPLLALDFAAGVCSALAVRRRWNAQHQAAKFVADADRMLRQMRDESDRTMRCRLETTHVVTTLLKPLVPMVERQLEELEKAGTPDARLASHLAAVCALVESAEETHQAMKNAVCGPDGVWRWPAEDLPEDA